MADNIIIDLLFCQLKTSQIRQKEGFSSGDNSVIKPTDMAVKQDFSE